MRSVGATWLDLGVEAAGEGGHARRLTPTEQDAQQRALTAAIASFDVVITTALVPGRIAPRLVTADAVRGMRPGSVVVDLAGATGGNCALSVPDQLVLEDGVSVLAPLDLASTLPDDASQLYARNIRSLLEVLIDDTGTLHLDFDDEIVAGACVTPHAAPPVAPPAGGAAASSDGSAVPTPTKAAA